MPDSLNICMVARKFPILGRATDHGFLWPVARGLVDRGHKVTILSWTNPDKKSVIEQDGVKAIFIGQGHGFSPGAYPEAVAAQFAELHRERPFDILHSIDSGGIIIGKKKSLFRIAVAYDVEATQLSQIYSILGMNQENISSLLSTAINVTYKFLTTYFGRDRSLLKTADALFVTSPQQRLALERYYLYPELKTHIVPYGIEISDLSPREVRIKYKLQTYRIFYS